MKITRTARTILLGTTLAIGASVGLAPLAHAAPTPTDKAKASPVVTAEHGSKIDISKIDPTKGPVVEIPGKGSTICDRFPALCTDVVPVKPPKSADPGLPTGTIPPKGTVPPKHEDPKPDPKPEPETPHTTVEVPVQAKVTFTG